MMLQQHWKTVGVIFTGGQGTWVIKLSSIFHSQKKKLDPSFTFPVKAQDLCGESVCVSAREREGEKKDVHQQTSTYRQGGLAFRHGRENTHTTRKHVMSLSEAPMRAGETDRTPPHSHRQGGHQSFCLSETCV